VHEQVRAGAEPQVILVRQTAGVSVAQLVVRQKDEALSALG